MAITERAAIEAAYHALQPLSPGARRRAVRWLSDALETEDDLILPAPAFPGVPAGATFDPTPQPPAAGVVLPTGPTSGSEADGGGATSETGRGARSRARAGVGTGAGAGPVTRAS